MKYGFVNSMKYMKETIYVNLCWNFLPFNLRKHKSQILISLEKAKIKF